MGRPLRITVPNLPFHIINRGNNRQVVFKEQEDFLYFLKLLKRYKKELNFKFYHFCLMPNHIHLMIEPTIEGSLSKIILKLTLAYTRYFNSKYKGVGHVWQGRYKSSLIDRGNYFVWCGIYNELNPVRAGLVEKPEEWRWSSFRFYAFGKANSLIRELIDPSPYYFELGNNPQERQKTYRETIKKIMKQDFLNDIRRKLDEGVFGGKSFSQEMKQMFKIKSLRSRGRPKKK